MDKKNFSIGAVLLVAAFALMYFGPKSSPTPEPATAAAPASATAPTASPGTPAATPATTSAATPNPEPTANTILAPVYRQPADTSLIELANDLVIVRLTPWGGAVREIVFKQHPAVIGGKDPYVFNHQCEDPLLAFTDYPGLGRGTRYDVVESKAGEVAFRTVLNGRIEVTRRYRLMPAGTPGGDPYRIRHETTFRNLTNGTEAVASHGLSIGTAALIDANDTGQHLNVVRYDGKDASYIERGELEGGGIGSLIGSPKPALPSVTHAGPTVWAAAKNQFFASIYTPDTPATGVTVRRIDLGQGKDAAAFPRGNIGLTGAVRCEVPALAANASATVGGALYVGPQEYKRLSQFQHSEDSVLPYTQYFFNRIFLSGYVAPLLNTLLNTAHHWVGNWGVAIVIMTLILKFVSLPFTLAASKSAKRMAKLQPLMQEIREKYKDNPQKQQQATMELFKAHKVNPLGGCIPILITFPLFIGFFAMLQGSAELRFQGFLWASDLAAPDTIAHIWGLPINIMPLLMGATMYYQMHLTPTPSVDNAQAKMMKFMPVIFTLFCYSFSCALSLYSTINGLFTIIQQLIVNRTKDEEPVAVTTGPGGKPIKNVTPRK
jgi:YidC/Oxa1 family membrane protein insertase